MKNLTYREFLALVVEADGPFGYRCMGLEAVCAPVSFQVLRYGGLGFAAKLGGTR